MDSQPEITPEMLQSNPGLLVGLVAFALFLFVAFLGSVGSWAFCGYRLFAGKSLLQTLPWKPRSWGLTELAVAFVAMVGCQVLLMELAIPLLGIERDSLAESTPLSLAAVMGLGSLLTVLITCAVIAMRFGSSATHMGFKFSGLPKQLFIGLVAGLTTIPVTMAISALVTLASEQEYDHPILDGMADEGTLTSFLLACFAAVIVAPFAEEFLFRVLLQGWLQSIPFRDVWSNLRGSEPSSGAQLSPGAMLESPVQGVLDEIEENHTPYAPPSTMEPPAPLESVENSLASVENSAASVEQVPPIWPSILSGILFGLAHWGYGLSFIPLIFLGIVLGLVYRATQSIWPCVLIHFMLNFTSMAALGISVFVQKAAGS